MVSISLGGAGATSAGTWGNPNELWPTGFGNAPRAATLGNGRADLRRNAVGGCGCRGSARGGGHAHGGLVSLDDVGAGTLLFKTRRPGRFIAVLAGRDFKLAWTLAMRSNFRAAARRLFLSAVGRTRPCLVRRGRIWDISRQQAVPLEHVDHMDSPVAEVVGSSEIAQRQFQPSFFFVCETTVLDRATVPDGRYFRRRCKHNAIRSARPTIGRVSTCRAIRGACAGYRCGSARDTMGQLGRMLTRRMMSGR